MFETSIETHGEDEMIIEPSPDSIKVLQIYFQNQFFGQWQYWKIVLRHAVLEIDTKMFEDEL